MKRPASLVSFFLLIAVTINPLYPCSESSIAPVFQYKYAPENPFENFANGKIGILKPTYRRVVLFAAYRFLNDRGFSADEQKALVEVWNAEFKNQEPKATDSREIIKKWLEKRHEVFRDEKELPSIYVEREYGGYVFFPNCNINAFETAIETLSDRIASYGSDEKGVAEWVKGQDAVFTNCASGKKLPIELYSDSPVWLQKDRQYQIAAAAFYSMNFDEAKSKFEQIALDTDSVWQETADYLIGRTLIRKASFTKDETERGRLYAEAENHFNLMGSNNKFSDSANRLINLVKAKNRPAERTRELAQSLLFQQYGGQLRQDLIDYTWLLDKFETDILKAEEKRKEDAEIAKFAEADRILRERISKGLAGIGVSVDVIVLKGEVTLTGKIPAEKYGRVLSIATEANPTQVHDNLTRVTENPDGSITTQGGNLDEGSRFPFGVSPELSDALERGDMFRIFVSGDDSFNSEPRPSGSGGYGSWSSEVVYARANESDDEIFERFWGGRRLSDKRIKEIRNSIREARAEQIRDKFENKPQADYEGGYYGDETISLRLIPEYLRNDDLTDWLFTFQSEGESAYLHALEKWHQNKSDLWLTAAIAKAHKNSKDIDYLLARAAFVSQDAPAFPTIAFHRARILIEFGKDAEAAKLLDQVLGSNPDLPISSRNQFAELRMKIAATLNEFLINATRRAFTFADYSKSTTIEEAIEYQKAWWSTGFEQSKADWDRQTEEQFEDFKLWENREMFDDETVKIINEHFPLSVLLEAQKSGALPRYLREKLAMVIWTRATLLEDDAVLRQIAPEMSGIAPETREYLTAKTPQALRFASLFVIFRHRNMVPFLKSGVNTDYATFSEAAGRWCEVLEFDYDQKGNEILRRLPPKPAFLTVEQMGSAENEMKKLKQIGSAPAYLSEKAKEWLKLAPKDKRLPEVLFQASQANEEYRYGCGNFLEQDELMNLLKKNFPESFWNQYKER